MSESITQKFIGRKVLIRGDCSGVFIGILADASPDGRLTQLIECRRLWYWSGASSTDEIACRGVSRPENCKFPAAVPEKTITDTIEITAMTDEAWQNIEKIPAWTQH